jgi:predicted amino acid-binding ACT domain protein
MILLARFPASAEPESVRQRIVAAGRNGPTELAVTVRAADDALPAQPQSADDHTYLLTARGPDRVGFVASVSAFCADHALNILDLSTAVAGGQYVMMLLVDVRNVADLDRLRQRLRAFGQAAGLEAMLQHEAIFRATNEVDQ